MPGTNKMPKTAEAVRQEFLDFFAEKNHAIVPSASLVPHEDPTLLFINAGMNQFKDVFLGTGTRPYRRAADAQKCLRVSGKHNDLEEVGHDTYHHTFFEMLGNWSFGDYFKKEAIAWAWELLTERWSIEPDRLYATVHAGDDALGLGPDDEAATIWRQYIPDERRVLYCTTKDNFWMMGNTGPCGPCSEIHIDLRSDAERNRIPGWELVNKDHPEVIELWNLVFIQFNALADGGLKPLVDRHVDTGMGLERLVAALQHSTSTYDTDLLVPLLDSIAQISPDTSIRGYDDVTDGVRRNEIRVAMRVVADHIRAIAFAVADGVVPGNVGRAYVIRRILRRAVRYGYTSLSFREPFLCRLVAPLVALMGKHYAELVTHQDMIERTVRGEEVAFLRTLGNGVAMFDLMASFVSVLTRTDPAGRRQVQRQLIQEPRATDLLKKAYGATNAADSSIKQFVQVASVGNIPGELAFLLHDTYGFPLDLTQLMAKEKGLGVDVRRYRTLMQEQVQRARKDLRSKRVSLHTGKNEDDWHTISTGRHSLFLGYDTLAERGLAVREIHRVKPFMVVMDATPFYAEKGGQVGDTGILRIAGDEVKVLDTQDVDGQIRHVVDRLPERADGIVYAEVDHERRTRICKHHTATHLLHAALRQVLGKGVTQKGSLVAPGHLRFDFNHFEKISTSDLREIQRVVNRIIQRNVHAEIENDVPIEQALTRGATALFNEKYGSHVRVVVFDEDYSVELCGGTHVEATGELGLLLLRSEGSIAAGIRRVEAVAGLDAFEAAQQEVSELSRVQNQLRGQSRAPHESIALLQEENKKLQKEVDRLRKERLAARLGSIVQSSVQVGPWRVAAGRLANTKMPALRALGQELAELLGANSVGVLGAADPEGGKAYLVVSVSDDLVSLGIKAGTIVGQLAQFVGGGGGGRPQLATAGGRRPEDLGKALQEVPAMVGGMLASLEQATLPVRGG